MIVSHDRALLENVEHIFELTSLGIHSFGGNFSFYQEQKSIITLAAQQDLDHAKKQLKKTNADIQATREKHEQNQAKGRNLKKTGTLDKLTLNSMKGRSEKTQSRLLTKNVQLTSQTSTKLQYAKEKVEIIPDFNFDLVKTYVPASKIVLKIEALSFYYDKPLITDFSLLLQGPERIALTGKNGSGKSTLIKLILRELKAHAGTIELNIEKVSYLDQHCSQLEPNKTILENFLTLNPEITNRDAHFALASFLFRNKEAEKLVHNLSGGEKLRALLACIFFSKTPPQLLILDEPTNHLDLHSIEVIEQALKYYQGAMIIVSHDRQFLENCGVKKYVALM